MSQSKLFSDDKLPTTSVHQARLQLFQPTRRPTSIERSITTPWGTGRVVGKIGQAHADVLEAILRHAEKHRVDDNAESPTFGALELLVDPHDVRRTAAGGAGKRLSYQQLKNLLVELMAVVIDIEGVRGVHQMRLGHIIDEVVDSTIEAPARPGTLTGPTGRRVYWYVRLSASFTRFFGEDLHLHYDPAPIARLAHGVSQAVARHILTHRSEPRGGWTIDGLLNAVGALEDRRNRRREIAKDAEQFAELGLQVEKGRLRWHGAA